MKLKLRNGSVMELPDPEPVEGLRGSRTWEAACAAAGVGPEDVLAAAKPKKPGSGLPIERCDGCGRKYIGGRCPFCGA